MLKSKELALIIIFAVTAFVYQASVTQVPFIITGIPGIGYYFVLGGVIIFGTAFLMFEGRRWRFFIFNVLYSLLMSFIFVGIAPVHLFRNIPMLTGAFIIDIVLNTLYEPFRKRKQIKWLAILQSLLGFSLLDTFLRILMFPFLMPPEFTSIFTSMTLTMFPLILFYGVIGGYVAYLIYSRIKRPIT